MLINWNIVIKTVGTILFIVGLFMVLPFLVSIIYGGQEWNAFLISASLTMIIGSGLYQFKGSTEKIRKREGYLIVSLSWIGICLVGSLPYYILFGEELGFVNALFESTSGFTTTGASIFSDIEALPYGILFWRSLSQWLGGMGIIVFTIAIFPLLGIGGIELFVAESPGIKGDKIHPRIKSVAVRLWAIYVGLTVLLCLILFFLSGMNFFDAINHSLTTISTGGFSTKNNSIGHFGPAAQYPIMIFMVIGGINFSILYYLFKRKFKTAFQSEEFRLYLTLLLFLISAIGITLYLTQEKEFEEALRTSAFQVITIITTCGFVTEDYTSWSNSLTFIFFLLLFVGGSAGSTAGGIKIIRHLVLLKNSILEFNRLLHPHAYIRLKIDKRLISGSIITHILVFLLAYILLFVLGSGIMMVILNNDPSPFLTAVGSVGTALANIGPAIGSVGPADNFFHLPQAGKLILSLFMIIGRLEIFTVLILFTPFFWRTQ